MKYFFSLITLIFFLSSCANEQTAVLTEEAILDSLNVFNGQLKEMDYDVRQDTALSNKIISFSEGMYEKYPENESVPEILFKAGEIANGLGNYQEAIKHWTRVWAKYPKASRSADALFLTGFAYDNDLRNHKEAEKFYNLFLERHPDSELAVQVQFLRDMLGKSDEELIELLQSRSQQ